MWCNCECTVPELLKCYHHVCNARHGENPTSEKNVDISTLKVIDCAGAFWPRGYNKINVYNDYGWKYSILFVILCVSHWNTSKLNQPMRFIILDNFD